MLSQLGRAKGHDPRTLKLQSERSTTEPHIGNGYKKEREKKEEKGEREEGEKGREGEKRRREMREGGPHIAKTQKREKEEKGERERRRGDREKRGEGRGRREGKKELVYITRNSSAPCFTHIITRLKASLTHSS